MFSWSCVCVVVKLCAFGFVGVRVARVCVRMQSLCLCTCSLYDLLVCMCELMHVCKFIDVFCITTCLFIDITARIQLWVKCVHPINEFTLTSVCVFLSVCLGLIMCNCLCVFVLLCVRLSQASQYSGLIGSHNPPISLCVSSLSNLNNVFRWACAGWFSTNALWGDWSAPHAGKGSRSICGLPPGCIPQRAVSQ